MNLSGEKIYRGTYSAPGSDIVLGLALACIFIPLPWFVLAPVLIVLTIVQFRASPLPDACLTVRCLRQPSLRSPPG